MNYIFLGSPEFAAIILEKLIKNGFRPSVVIANPDKPVGRKKIITPPPTKIIAKKYDIEIWQPEKLESADFKKDAWDFFVIAAYAKILTKEILDIPRLGTIGVHPSLLPKYRGPTPIQSALLNGEKETGVTLFLTDEKIDHGPMLTKSEIRISKSETYKFLYNKLARLSGDLLIETLPKFLNGEIKPVPQNENEATYTKKFSAGGGSAFGGKTEDAFVEPENLKKAQKQGGEIAILIDRKIRALNPEPGVWTSTQSETISLIRANKGYIGKPLDITQNKRIKILEAEITDGKLKLKKIQIEGKKPQIL